MKTKSHPFFFRSWAQYLASHFLFFFFSDGALINSFFTQEETKLLVAGVLNTDTDSAVRTRECVLFYRALQPVSDGIPPIKYFDLIA